MTTPRESIERSIAEFEMRASKSSERSIMLMEEFEKEVEVMDKFTKAAEEYRQALEKLT